MRLSLKVLPCFVGWALAACPSPGARSSEDVAVQVRYVAMDPRSQSPVVVLEELDGTRVLPIWIGFAEASSIASELRAEPSPRPGTHDLAKRLIDGLKAQLDRVVVNDVADGVYYALLFVRTPTRVIEIDARPSDAIAIALRTRSPLFVREKVLEEGSNSKDPVEEGQGI